MKILEKVKLGKVLEQIEIPNGLEERKIMIRPLVGKNAVVIDSAMGLRFGTLGCHSSEINKGEYLLIQGEKSYPHKVINMEELYLYPNGPVSNY